jgi:eukaryotic-like serine/threonine-protein kinase
VGIDINYFLNQKYEENKIIGAVKTIDLYSNIKNEKLRNLFAIMHQNVNGLISFMYDKKHSNGHYNADPSREFINLIKLEEDMEYVFKNSEYAFTFNENYKRMLSICSKFLASSNGSPIPSDLEEIELVEYEPIFTLSTQVSVPNKSNSLSNYPIKFIGEGSYAQVFKYKDEFYDKPFVIKRFKKNLSSKELQRFKKEYEIMKLLKSPYIIEVYRYDDTANEYYMEYADETLHDFISKNNTKIDLNKRKIIINQIFRGLEYIHAQGYLHRDLSVTNILLQHYPDLSIVKISDFGLVKDTTSTLTSFGSEFKGSFNDKNLEVLGFKNYAMVHETYALTRLVYYALTGKYNLDSIKAGKICDFVLKGVNPDETKRYQTLDEMKIAINNIFL